MKAPEKCRNKNEAACQQVRMHTLKVHDAAGQSLLANVLKHESHPLWFELTLIDVRTGDLCSFQATVLKHTPDSCYAYRVRL